MSRHTCDTSEVRLIQLRKIMQALAKLASYAPPGTGSNHTHQSNGAVERGCMAVAEHRSWDGKFIFTKYEQVSPKQYQWKFASFVFQNLTVIHVQLSISKWASSRTMDSSELATVCGTHCCSSSHRTGTEVPSKFDILFDEVFERKRSQNTTSL